MKSEDFEHKLRSHDPAANLEMRDPAEHRALLEQAISGQPANVIPISSWTKRRKAVSAAAAAILVVGFGGPIISGTSSATPDRLVFGQSQNNMLAEKSMPGAETRDAAMGDYYFGYWGFYHYELAADATTQVPTSAPAYKIVNIANIDQRVQMIADVLGVENLVNSEIEDGVVSNLDVESAAENFYAWTYEGSGSFSYFNSGVDPWRECYKEEPTRDTEPEECNPIIENLYTETEAKSAAKKLLTDFGFDTSSMRFDIYQNEYSTEVYIVELLNGIDTPISFYISYVANGDLYSAGGSLTKLVEVGTYDLVDVQAALQRANELTNRTVDSWNQDVNSGIKDVSPGNTGSKGSEDGDSSEPSDPTEPSVDPTRPTDEPTYIDEPIGPLPAYEPVNVTVTKVELGYQMFWMENQNALWLPVFNFIGTAENYDEVGQIGSIVAIVDSQIDLDSLYKSMGMVTPMSREAMLD